MAEKRAPSAMASDQGAAQNNELSPGGLSEVEAKWEQLGIDSFLSEKNGIKVQTSSVIREITS
jgi:hypothetical protein